MRLSVLISLIPLAAAVTTPADTRAPAAVAEPVDGENLVAVRDLLPLEKRQCDPGCRCVTGLRQGQYCGTCRLNGGTGAYVITRGRVARNVYECAPNGDCCSYGPANDCGRGDDRCGPY